MSNHGLAPQVARGRSGWASGDRNGSPLTLDAHASARVACGASPAPHPGLVVVIAVAVAACCIVAGVVSRRGAQRPNRRAEGRSRPLGALRLRRAEPLCRLLGGRCRRGDGVPLRRNPDALDAGAVSASALPPRLRRSPTRPPGRPMPRPARRWQRYRRNWPPTPVWSKRRARTTRRASRSGLPTCARRRRRCRPSCFPAPRRSTPPTSPESIRRSAASDRFRRSVSRCSSSPWRRSASARLIMFQPHEPDVQSRAGRRSRDRGAGARRDRRGRPPGGRRHRARPNRGHGEVRAARRGPHPRPAGPDRRDPATDHPRRHHRQREVVLRPHR